MLPDQKGRYIARPTQWTIEEGGENKLVVFVCSFELLQWLGNGGWEQIHDQQIIMYSYLTKKEGGVSDFAVKSLRESLGWDGRSLETLANSDWSHTEVQLTLDFEEYKGKNKIKVKFINPRDWEPAGVQKDPDLIKSLESRFGSMFRAAVPAGPARATSSPSPASNGNGDNGQAVVQAAMRKAWSAFKAKNPGKHADVLGELWKNVVKGVCPDRDSKTFSAADWVKVQSAIEHPVDAPFGQEEVFEDSSIPF